MRIRDRARSDRSAPLSGPFIGLFGFAAALVLILLRVPVGIAMGAVGVGGFAFVSRLASTEFVLGVAPFEAVFPYSLSVVPLFIMMGVFAARAGLSKSLYDAVNAFIGHARGGLAMATIGACAAFGAVCGSSLATVATMGRVAMPEMRRHGYDDRLAAASVAAGGTLGVLIPPSIILVIYGLLTETSIGGLFVAALIPGLLGTILYIARDLRRDPHPSRTRPRRAATGLAGADAGAVEGLGGGPAVRPRHRRDLSRLVLAHRGRRGRRVRSLRLRAAAGADDGAATSSSARSRRCAPRA